MPASLRGLTAGANPRKLAGAISSGLSVIDEDLAAARTQEEQALRAYKNFVTDVQNKRRRLAEFDEDIAKLMGQAQQIRAELDA